MTNDTLTAGVTGTQDGATPAQLATLEAMLRAFGGAALHHGDCVGADAQACATAKGLGMRLICHPPQRNDKRAFVPSDEYREPLPFLDRNHEIVRECDRLFVLPRGYTEIVRSGTWATYRNARLTGRDAVVIWPDGSHTVWSGVGSASPREQ